MFTIIEVKNFINLLFVIKNNKIKIITTIINLIVISSYCNLKRIDYIEMRISFQIELDNIYIYIYMFICICSNVQEI